MGWTSIYTDLSYDDLNDQNVLEIIEIEIWKDYPISMFHFFHGIDRAEIYCIHKHPKTNNIFISVTLIDIIGKQLLYKEMEEAMGPCYYNCPIDYFKFVNAPNSIARRWRDKCRKLNVQYDYELANQLLSINEAF